MRVVLNFLGADDLAFQADAGGWTTIGQVLAPNHTTLQLVEVAILFEGVVTTDPPVLVQLVRQTDAGTGGVARDLVHEEEPKGIIGLHKYREIRTSGLVDIDGSEPATEDILRSWHIHPQSGIVYPYRPSEGGRESITVMPERRLGVRVYPQDAVDVTGYIVINEGNML